MADVIAVPQAPALSHWPNVELMHAGTWNISTGVATFTPGDLAAAVAALDCPAVRRPVLKLGHTDPRFDGEPAVGWIDNMATTDDGGTLMGDYVGMPGWLGPILASAYPDRSVEGRYDVRCQIGHVHPFVLTGVAFLGVTPPGIGTLESLQDVAKLYGVAAAGDPVTGRAVTITVEAKGAPAVPAPKDVSAAASSEDVRRAYYDSPDVGWDLWIEQMILDPTQLIVVNDATGARTRVPFTVDGDAIAFGEPVAVKVEYVDVTAPKVAASAQDGADAGIIRWETRAASRPAPGPTPTNPPAPVKASGPAHSRGAGMDPVKLREALDLPVGASDIEVAAAIAAANLSPTPVPAPAALPEGVVAVDEAAWQDTVAAAAEGRAAATRLREQDRDNLIGAAVRAGKFAPSRSEHWAKAYNADPEGARAAIESLEPGLLPVAASGGYAGENGAPADDKAFEAEVDALFGLHNGTEA